MNVRDCVAAFREARLERDAFWARMQECHRDLAAYAGLLEGDVERLEITREGPRVVLRNGLVFHWDVDDLRTAPNMVVNHGAYEAPELAALLRLAQGARVVFDIGANIGWYSLHLGQAIGSAGGVVHAFEPIADTFGSLTRNLALNAAGRHVRPHNLAFGEAPGDSVFYLPAFTGSVAASARPLFPDGENREVRCAVVRLDDFAGSLDLPALDLLKCDVEGAELLVLRGARETLRRHRPVLMLEMLRKWARAYDYHPDAIIALLGELGYECFGVEGGELRRFAHVDETCAQTNFFFLHREAHPHVPAILREAVGAA